MPVTLVEIVVVAVILVILVTTVSTIFIKQVKKWKANLLAQYSNSAWTTPPPLPPNGILDGQKAISFQVLDRNIPVGSKPVTFTLGGSPNPAAKFSDGSREITVNTVPGTGVATVTLVNDKDGDDKVTVSFKVETTFIKANAKDDSTPIFEVQE